MLKTPHYEIDDESVYPPAEDTFILLDALEADLNELRQLELRLIVEIGCGSGIVSTFFYQLLDQRDKAPRLIICTDINPAALRCTRKTIGLNDVPTDRFDLINCDMATPMLGHLSNKVDLLLFNPPYVPSEEPASTTNDFYYAGGSNGRVVIDRALAVAARLLTTRGAFYLVALKANRIEEMREFAKTNYQLNSHIVLERRCGIEYLYVLKFVKN